jgi:16S rRNA (cytosine1402-N4)-methyltransferase
MRIEPHRGFSIVEWDTMSAAEGQRDAEAPEPSHAVHRPVMAREAVEWLAPGPSKTIVDCTSGLGGHGLALLPHLMPSGELIALDCDAEALEQSRKRLVEFQPHIRVLHANFRDVAMVLKDAGVSQAHGLLADLGFSSLQVDTAERGFSFQREGPLDMRMDPRQPLTAAALIHRLSEYDLANLLFTVGEERWSRRIAKRIVEVRKRTPIRTTTQLAEIVADAAPRRGRPRIHPATRTFQALRIAVNDELAALDALLASLPEILLPGGRAVIITFHSLEDRRVKQAFQRGAREGLYRVLTKKPMRAGGVELVENPRARSAKLRAVERLPGA